MRTLLPLPITEATTIGDGEVYQDLVHLETMIDFDEQAKELERTPLPFIPAYLAPYLRDAHEVLTIWGAQDYDEVRRRYTVAFLERQKEAVGNMCSMAPQDFIALYQ
jgi:hypothetical protein